MLTALASLAAFALPPSEVGTSSPAVDRGALEDELFGRDESRRESDLFGRDAALDERGDGLLERMRDSLSERNDVLSIGGQALLQLQGNLNEGQPVEDGTVSAPSFLEVYLDGRPSDRLRAFVLGRVQTNLAAPGQEGDPADTSNALFGFGIANTTAILDQLWLKADIDRRVFFTAGKQRLRWGSGQFFNPTDFVNRQRLNPVALLDQRVGIGLLKVHVPLEAQGVNLYAILDFEDADRLENMGGALRGEFAFGRSEVATSVAYQRDRGLRGGIDLSAGIWEFDFRSEVSVAYLDRLPFYEGAFSTQPLVTPDAVDRSRELVVQAVAGADVTIRLSSDGDTLTLGAEYFFNGGGYGDKDLFPFLIFASAGPDVLRTAGADIPTDRPQVGFDPFTSSRHYVAALAVLSGPGSWDDTTFILSAIADPGATTSGIARIDVSHQALTFLNVRAFINVVYGGRGAFKPLLRGDRFQLIEGANPLPGLIPQLDQAFAPIEGFEALLNAGVALNMSF